MQKETIDFKDVLQPGGVKMVEGSDEMRAKKCLDQIQKVLAAFDCAMAPMIVLGPQGVQRAAVNVIPVPRQPKLVGGGVADGG